MGLECVKHGEGLDLVRHECLVPFIRQVVGPIDYTQGAMRNAQPTEYRASMLKPMSQGTRCRQLAEYVIFESPFNMLCDAPTQYEKNQKCTDFIGAIPTVWDEMHVFKACLGKYVVEARRKGDVWYLGGITDSEPRDVEIDLSRLHFVKAPSSVLLYRDGSNVDKDAEDYMVENLQYSPVLKVHLASGGGFAAIVK